MPSPSTRRRNRRAPVVASAEANIVLPKPGVAAVLPPAPTPEAEHIEPADVVRPKLPPGTRRAPTLAQLQERAKKANKQSKARVDITIRIDVPIYAALIELAEEYHVSMADVARQCLADGARKYRDFSSPFVDSPFRPTTPMRANAEIVVPFGHDRPRTGAFAPGEVHARSGALLADDLTGPIPGHDRAVEERANASLAEMATAAAHRLGAVSFLPNAGGKTAPSVGPNGVLAYDPLAPTPDEDDPGTTHATELTADAGGYQ